MKLFAQIRKVDEEKRLVFGRLADESVDKADESMDYLSSKPHFQKWSADIAKDTDGKSLGNLRAMHGKVAAGKFVQIDFDDEAKTIDVCAKVVDDGEWKKVLEGVYTGFSIGGSYVGDKKVAKMDGRDVTRYTAAPNEGSLVDRPCIPTAKFFEVQKADGSLRKVEFQPAPAEAEDVTVNGTADEVAALGKLMNTHGLTLADLVEKAVPAFIADKAKDKKGDDADDEKSADGKPKKKPAAEEKTDAEKAAAAGELQKAEVATLRKGVYDCDGFSNVLQRLVSLQSSAAYEAMRGGDSAMSAKLSAAVSMVGEIFKELIDSVIANSGTAAASPAGVAMLALSEQAGELVKASASDFEKVDTDPLVALLKVGARNSTADTSRLAKIHALTVELGHTCAPADKAAGTGDLTKVDPSADLQKMVDAAVLSKVEPLEKLLAEARADLKKIADQPMPARVALRAVSKAADTIVDNDKPVAKVEPITDDHGTVHEAASLIKSLHQTGGAPLRKD